MAKRTRTAVGGSPRRAQGPDELGGALAALLDHEGRTSNPALLEALLEARSNSAEQALRLAAEQVLGRCAPWSLHLDADLRALVNAAGNERDQQVFRSCVLGQRGRPTLVEIGADIGVSAARVGQIRDRAKERVRAALEESPGHVRWAIRSLRCRLGQLSSVADAHEVLTDHGIGSADRTGELALWLAGPYDVVPGRPGWLGIDLAKQLAAPLDPVAQDGGVRSHAKAGAASASKEGAKHGRTPAKSRPAKSRLAAAKRGSVPPESERSWLWVRVDPEVLRGAEAEVPSATAELVGLGPSQQRTFSSRFGPVTLSRDHDLAQRGSVRAVALAAGANDGDTLILGFGVAGDLLVEVHRPAGQREAP